LLRLHQRDFVSAGHLHGDRFPANHYLFLNKLYSVTIFKTFQVCTTFQELVTDGNFKLRNARSY
jgi:hypothetical protein